MHFSKQTVYFSGALVVAAWIIAGVFFVVMPAGASQGLGPVPPRTVLPPPPGSPLTGMVSLNFDDGFLSSYEIAFPILEEAGMRGTAYVISEHMKPPLYMSRSQVQELQERGHEIGAHTRTHLPLNQLSDDAIRDEVIGSKEDLEKLGLRIHTFSYPYGEYDARVLAVVKDAGFIAARGTHPGFNDAASDPYILECKSIEQGRSVENIRRLIDEAMEEDKWLVLAFHRIGHDTEKVSAPPEMLRQIVAYLVEKEVPVVTMREGYEAVFRRE